ncbi:MAG: hypothetical protein K0R67_2664 [Paenibacillus sp.]|nr:hypothetical protein [Paenibacillus sp.]
MQQIRVKTYYFRDDGAIPNHPAWPVILYPGVWKDQPEQTETLFNRHHWLNSWTNGVYDYHHYHSNTHEVLGVIQGSAVIQLGGKLGRKFQIQTGDVLLLPAGTGHKKISSSDDFLIVGAYPEGSDYNLHTGEESDRPEVLEEIKQVPAPWQDPVYGEDGPVQEYYVK